MAALCLLLAIALGTVVGDLVLENPTAADLAVAHHTVIGFTEGQLLAMAAALGAAVGLLLLASASTTRRRRARRKQGRSAVEELRGQVAELERENARLAEELDRLQRVYHLGELSGPTDQPVAVPSHRAEPHPEPLYEEARRAARLRGEPDRFLWFAGDERERRS